MSLISLLLAVKSGKARKRRLFYYPYSCPFSCGAVQKEHNDQSMLLLVGRIGNPAPTCGGLSDRRAVRSSTNRPTNFWTAPKEGWVGSGAALFLPNVRPRQHECCQGFGIQDRAALRQSESLVSGEALHLDELIVVPRQRIGAQVAGEKDIQAFG